MKTWLAHFVGPAMEARDVRAGESNCDRHYEEIQAETETEATEKARKMAEEVAEGWELTEMEELLPPCNGFCQPTCSTCSQAADEAYQNEILENGY